MFKDLLNYIIVDNVDGDDGDIVASNLLESELWERLVYWVAKWIKQLAEENNESIEQIIDDIIDEQENFNL